MLTPYLLLSAVPADLPDEIELGWATPVFRLCAMTYTESMDSELPFMIDSEDTDSPGCMRDYSRNMPCGDEDVGRGSSCRP